MDEEPAGVAAQQAQHAVLARGPEEGDVVGEARQETQHRAVGNHGGMLAQARRPAPAGCDAAGVRLPSTPAERSASRARADPAHVAGGEARAFGRLHVHHVVVEEEDPPAGDRQPGGHGVEDRRRRASPGRARRRGSGRSKACRQRDRLVVGRPLEARSCWRGTPPGPSPAPAATSSSGARDRAARASCRTRAGRRPAPGRAPSRRRSRRRTPRACSRPPRSDAPSGQPSQRVHSASSLSIPLSSRIGADAAGLDEHPAEVEQDEVDRGSPSRLRC